MGRATIIMNSNVNEYIYLLKYALKAAKIALFFWLSLLLISCQSSRDITGENHKLATEQWYELAEYSKRRFKKQKLIITAKLDITDNPSGKIYQLKNIGLDLTEKTNNINLLSPNFDGKYICETECKDLRQYIASEGSTLLTHYFNNHKYQLYKFYGDLSILSDQLNELSNSHENFKDYVSLLATDPKRFRTLNEFSTYLEKAFSLASFQNFVSNPYPFYFPTLIEEKINVNDIKASQHHDGIFPTPKDDGSDIESSLLQLWVTTPVIEKTNWETEKGKSIDGINNEALKSRQESYWSAAKEQPIAIKDIVCSYQENYFGLIDKLSTDNIVISLIGQAVESKDNIIALASPGTLFLDNNTVTYSTKSGNKRFSRQDIARCNIN